MKKAIFILSLFFVSIFKVNAQVKEKRWELVCEYPAITIAPEFATNLTDYINRRLEYPKKAKRRKTEGEVVASFIIEKDGTISNIAIKKSLQKECDEAVINLIKRMPKWRPALEKGRFVRFFYEFTVPFRLNNNLTTNVRTSTILLKGEKIE